MGASRLERLEQAGYEPREWQRVLAEVAPERLDAWLAYASSMRETGGLERKVRELIVLAIDSYVQWPHTEAHVEAALDAGATVEEIVDTLATVGYLKGPHAWVTGLEALGRVLERRRGAQAP